MVPVVGFRGFQGKDEEISDSRIVISSEARNLPCRPINDRCVKAEIRSAKVSFPCQCLCLLSRIAVCQNQRSPAAVNRLLGTHFPTLFHTASALSAPTASYKSPRRFPVFMRRTTISHFSFLISHFSFLIRAKLSSAIHGRGAHELTLPPQTAAFAAVFLDFLLK